MLLGGKKQPWREKNQELLQNPPFSHLNTVWIKLFSSMYLWRSLCEFLSDKCQRWAGWRVGVPFGKQLLVFCFVLLVYKKIDRYVMSCLVFWSYWRVQVRVRYRDFQRQFLQKDLLCLLIRGNLRLGLMNQIPFSCENW